MQVNGFFDQVLLPISKQILECRENCAFYINGVSYSYAVLGTKICQIRVAIQHQKIIDDIVALAVHDDVDTYAAIIALWMEGKAYVPLHPNQPLDRNLNILAQVGTNYIIDSAKESPFEASGFQIIKTTSCLKKICIEDPVQVPDDNLAYILFTSGSTGTPKGVCLSRKNIATFMDSFWKTGIEITSSDKCLQAFDLTFDVSIQSFLVALVKGASVYTIPYGQVKYLYAAELMLDQGITFGAMAPSMLSYLRPYFSEMKIESLKTCILTAEACPVDLMEDWFKCAVNTDIYDFYGPTEATIYCTCYKLHRDETNLSSNGIISIGKPLANVNAIIIDEDGTSLGQGIKGELCVAGDQITRGYWKNDERNDASFFIKEIEGELLRFYSTGDLCYWDKSGNIIYSGRIDQQAKIQGYRVELGEIEYHARTFYDNNCRSVAISFNNEKGLTEIALFIESIGRERSSLEAYLKSKMPQYMIPSRIIYLDTFPLNHSDKIDRAALKQLI